MKHLFFNKKISYPIFFIVGILVAVQLGISNLLGAKGQDLAFLEKKESEISHDIGQLREELASKNSLYKIALEAEKINLSFRDNATYLESNLDVAVVLR